MTQDKLVERIARALVREAGNDPDEVRYGRRGDIAPSLPRWYALRPVARAILADLASAGLCIVPREPTEGMKAAGGGLTERYIGDLESDEEMEANDKRAAGDVYRAMIAAAGEG